MIKLDDNLLVELGLANLPPEEKKKILAHIYETLEMRVGMKLAEQMTDAQLDEFEQFINRNDEAGALRWLETNFPHYKEVVAQEFEKLKDEIRQVAPQILASAQQAAAVATQQGQQPQPQTQPQHPQMPPQQYQQPQYAQQPMPQQQPHPQAAVPPAHHGVAQHPQYQQQHPQTPHQQPYAPQHPQQHQPSYQQPHPNSQQQQPPYAA